jgi:hypothetical protein
MFTLALKQLSQQTLYLNIKVSPSTSNTRVWSIILHCFLDAHLLHLHALWPTLHTLPRHCHRGAYHHTLDRESSKILSLSGFKKSLSHHQTQHQIPESSETAGTSVRTSVRKSTLSLSQPLPVDRTHDLSRPQSSYTSIHLRPGVLSLLVLLLLSLIPHFCNGLICLLSAFASCIVPIFCIVASLFSIFRFPIYTTG